MKRFKKNIILTTTPIALYLGYRLRKKVKIENEKNQKELQSLIMDNIMVDKVRFDEELTYEKHWVPQNIARGAKPPLKTRKENIEELKTKDFDILIKGSSPLAALTLLEATNRGLKVALITESDFSASNSDRSHRSIHMLDSGLDIFKNAVTFKYGALSPKMLGHAFEISKARLKLKDLAPRSVKEEYYHHYYSSDLSRIHKFRALLVDTVWKGINIVRTAFAETDAGFSLPFFINQERRFKQNKRGALLQELHKTHQLKQSRLMTKEFEVDWDSFVRDAILTATVQNYIIEGKTGASVLNKAKILTKQYHATNERVELVSVEDLASGKVFDIKTSCLLDFTEPTPDSSKYMYEGVYKTGFSFQDFSLLNPKKYCIQTNQGKTYFQGQQPSFQQNASSALRVMRKLNEPENLDYKAENFQKLSASIQSLPISESESKILAQLSSPQYHYSLFKNSNSDGEVSLNLELLKREGFQVTTFVDRIRAKKNDLSLFLSYHIHRLINYCHQKRYSSPYTIEPALLHSYDWKSERDGSYIQIIGGHPSLAISYASRIIDDLMKEKLFLFTNPQVNPNYESLGFYPFLGYLSTPGLSSKDLSAATSLSKSPLFKQELQQQYLITDALFSRLFHNYGFSGTLRILQIGRQLNKTRRSKQLNNSNFEKIEEAKKRFESYQAQQGKEAENSSSEESKEQLPKKKEVLYTAAQVVYMCRYMGLNSLQDLIKGRWGLVAENSEQLQQIVKIGLEGMKEENEWSFNKESEELRFMQDFSKKRKEEK